MSIGCQISVCYNTISWKQELQLCSLKCIKTRRDNSYITKKKKLGSLKSAMRLYCIFRMIGYMSGKMYTSLEYIRFPNAFSDYAYLVAIDVDLLTN
jgi:hypothetical protein